MGFTSVAQLSLKDLHWVCKPGLDGVVCTSVRERYS
jgi:hypothetical protein